MKIAFDYQTFVLQSYGGIPRYFTELSRGLHRLGQPVRVFAPMHRNSYLSILPNEIVNGRYLYKYPPKMSKVISLYNRYVSQIQIAKWQPELVHETYYSEVSCAPFGCPTVITVHDMIHELFPEEFSPLDTTTVRKRIATDRATHIICVSLNTKKDLMRLHNIPEKKISVVYHGVDQFAVKNARSTHDGRPFILYVGQRYGYKNFNGLLRAFASSKDLMKFFDIVAFGNEKFSLNELRMFNSLGFQSNQIKHQSGSDSTLARLYSSARAFIYPSLYEGFGMSPLEAMVRGCPVVSSNSSSIPEVIGNAGEYFDPLDTEDMQRAIERVVLSDTYIRSLQKLGMDRVKLFSWEKCVKETFDIYSSI